MATSTPAPRRRAGAAFDRALALQDAVETARELRRAARDRAAFLRAVRRLPPVAALVIGTASRRATHAGEWRSLRAARHDRVASSGHEPEAVLARVWAGRLVLRVREVVCATEDTDQLGWTVRELDARDAPGAGAATCLVFENHQIVRRLWAFPADWAALGDGALLRVAGLRPAAT
jgi:hypothetical protein